MRRAVALAMALMAGTAFADTAFADVTKTFGYACKGGNFTVTATIDSAARWSKTDPVILRIGAEPPQTLIADPDAPDADSYKNKDYEFYALKTFITLTHKSHGTVVKFYSGCRVEMQ